MGWRDKYKVHPAADVFPMMLDEELLKLADDIKKFGLRERIKFHDQVLVDGRNRLRAMELAGIEVRAQHKQYVNYGTDLVTYIISANIHRRHLTKEERAGLIIAAHKAAAAARKAEADARKADKYCGPDGGEPKPRQAGEVSSKALLAELEAELKSKGGRGKIDEVKAAAVKTAAKHGISKRTVERAIAKSEGKEPRPVKARAAPVCSGLDAARRTYLDWCVKLDADLDAEQNLIFDAFREIAGKRARLARKQASTLLQDGQSEDGRGDTDDFPEIPADLDRRRS
jgi:ParB-like chromosome segregation protein Spo0J